jgi:hypothetical protein
MANELWIAGTHLSQEMIDLAQELNDKYPNLSLAWIPPENRGMDDDKPFAIVQVDSEGNQVTIIHRMHQFLVHGSYIFNWLWEHDSQRVDLWDKLQKQIAYDDAQREKLNTERMDERADILHTVAKSNKHTFKLNGHKIGSDNNYPTLGLSDAGRTEN